MHLKEGKKSDQQVCISGERVDPGPRGRHSDEHTVVGPAKGDCLFGQSNAFKSIFSQVGLLNILFKCIFS